MITAAAVQLMPERIIMHYNASGEADRLGSRYESFVLCGITIALALFWHILALRFEKNSKNADDDKQRAHSRENAKVIEIAGIASVAVLALMQIVHVFRSVKGIEYAELDELKIMCALMGIMFIVLGGLMPKTKPNGSIGLRIKWSMYNDVTWQKSNRFAGIALIAAGVLSFVTAAVAGAALSVVMLLVYLFAATAISSVYAKKVYDEQKEKE